MEEIIGMKTSDAPIIVEEYFNVSISEAWKAITEREQMIQWFFDAIPNFKPEVGFSTSFNINTGSRDFPHLWTITEVLPEQKIVYLWEYEGYEGESEVIFEVFRSEDKTGVRVTGKILKDFPDGIIEFVRESGVKGWNYFICERLKEYLN